jgi:hypothetical protein
MRFESFFLANFMTLPFLNCFLMSLGGGRRRREVGATVSLLHPFDLIVVIKLPNSTLCIGIAEHGVCENLKGNGLM